MKRGAESEILFHCTRAQCDLLALICPVLDDIITSFDDNRIRNFITYLNLSNCNFNIL